MRKYIISCFLTLLTIFGLSPLYAQDVYTISLSRLDTTVLEGYFSPPQTINDPIIFAIQDSTCESTLPSFKKLSALASSFGFGVIAFEKEGISQNAIDLAVYHQTNCLYRRLEDYTLCLQHMQILCPGWQGKSIFWGESEGGILAAILAQQTPETAAVILVSSGGGMTLQEEIKWTLHHRLEKSGAMQHEIDQHMNFLEDQLEIMKLDSTSEKQFLGKTYKWWISFLDTEGAILALKQHCFPICLIHGTHDNQVPVLSADLLAESLRQASALTYLRLEGYGHDLSTPEVQDMACQWLASVLLGQDFGNSSLRSQVDLSAPALLEDLSVNLPEYIFNRGRNKGEGNREGQGDVYGTTRFDRDSDGNEKASVAIEAKHDFGNGWDVGLKGGTSGSKDKEGNIRGEVHAEARIHGAY